MIKFSREKVILLHQMITAETGGDPNIRDVGLLESALESAFAPLAEKKYILLKKKRVQNWVIR